MDNSFTTVIMGIGAIIFSIGDFWLLFLGWKYRQFFLFSFRGRVDFGFSHWEDARIPPGFVVTGILLLVTGGLLKLFIKGVVWWCVTVPQ